MSRRPDPGPRGPQPKVPQARTIDERHITAAYVVGTKPKSGVELTRQERAEARRGRRERRRIEAYPESH
jgi:hypothetical protein